MGAGNLVGNAISGIFWLLIASILDAESYGVINYQLATAGILGTLSLLGLNNAVITFLAKGNEDLVKQAGLFVLIGSTTIAILLAIFDQVYTAILLLGFNAFSLTVAEALGRKTYKRYMLLVVVNRTFQFGLSLGLYYLMGAQGIILGYGLSYLVLGYKLFLIKNFDLSFKEIRSRFRFVLHSFSLMFSQSLFLYLDKLIIAPLAGFAALGLYQIGFQFLLFLSVIPISLYQYLLSQEASGTDRKAIRKLGLILGFVLAISSYFMMPYAINWFFPHYVDAIPSAQLIVLGIIPLTLNSLMNSRLLGRENSRPVLVGSATYSISLISLIFALNEPLGVMGLALSVIISLSLQSLALWISSSLVSSTSSANSSVLRRDS